jgi:hypothetical protein
MGGDIFKAFMPTGEAKTESGESIYFRDVDQDKLNSGRQDKFPGFSMSSSGDASDDSLVPVNDSKGGVGNIFFPSTSLVRESLRPVETVKNTIDPYTGFSEAFMDSPLPSADTPLPSSQRSVSPISQARDSFQEDNVTEYMGRPLGDDDDQPKVGQNL